MRANIRKPLLLSAPINPHNAVQRVEKNFHGKASDQRIFVTLHGMIFQSRETRTKANVLPLSTRFTIYDLMDTLLEPKGIRRLASFLAEPERKRFDCIDENEETKVHILLNLGQRKRYETVCACISVLRVPVFPILIGDASKRGIIFPDDRTKP